MSNREKVLLGVIVVLVFGVIFLFRELHTMGPVVLPQQLSTKEDVPANIKVPGLNETDVPAGVAVPKDVIQAGPTSPANFRSFDIKVNGDSFTPDKIIVREGDTVHISIVAMDKNYDFTQLDYGIKFPLPRGKTKLLEFGATNAGKFTFYCAMCGGPTKAPVGYFIIVPR